MRTLLSIIKHRLLSLMGWMTCSFIVVIMGWIIGAGIGYLCEAMGWVEYPNVMFSGLAFLIFPFVGGIVGLIAMHVARVMSWIKLHRNYMKEHEGWTKNYTMRIVIIDETAWLITFATICLLLASVM